MQIFVIRGESRNKLALLFLLVCVSISGCTIPLTCELYNNTGKDLIVTWSDGNGDELEEQFEAGSIIQLESWQLYDYKIVSSDFFWSYNQISPAHDLIKFSGFGPWSKRLFRAQLEGDGRIFLLQTDQSPPVLNFSEQPDEFPLMPERHSK